MANSNKVTNKFRGALSKYSDLDTYNEDLENNWGKTENGQDSLKDTGSALVNLFAQIGAMGNYSENDVIYAFQDAISEDLLLSTKLMFYGRDIRHGGTGQRKVFRTILNWMGDNYPEIVLKNMENIPFFGRWDDLLSLIDTKVEKEMWSFIEAQLENDWNSSNPSLLAKWLPSCNTSSIKTRALGYKVYKALGMNQEGYRLTLSILRERIGIVETLMSKNKWDEINYSAVPSNANKNYSNAFKKHDEERYEEFIGRVEKGEVKIHADTLYPYDIIMKMGFYFDHSLVCDNNSFQLNNWSRALQALWDNLPNYIQGNHNALVMADTSYSMTENKHRPIVSSLGLATYFGERNTGIWKDVFITFSSHPKFVELKGDNLQEKFAGIPSIVENTNLESAFKLILNTAIRNHIAPEEMIESLIIISDMKFDKATTEGGSGKKLTFYDNMKNMFKINGYQIPNIVFWNVNAEKDTFHAFSDYENVQMISGYGVASFKHVFECIGLDPYGAMEKVLNGEVYDRVVI